MRNTELWRAVAKALAALQEGDKMCQMADELREAGEVKRREARTELARVARDAGFEFGDEFSVHINGRLYRVRPQASGSTPVIAEVTFVRPADAD